MSRQVTRVVECQHCHEFFEYVGWDTTVRKFCSGQCHKAWRRQAASDRSVARKLAEGRPGAFALEVDPWRTGQLPGSVMENRLWR